MRRAQGGHSRERHRFLRLNLMKSNATPSASWPLRIAEAGYSARQTETSWKISSITHKHTLIIYKYIWKCFPDVLSVLCLQ